MTASTAFWAAIDAQLAELTTARGAADVLRILATETNPYNDPTITHAPAFFAGSGGDGTVMEALTAAGWDVTWAEASYHYGMRAPDGTAITYCEGDIFPETPAARQQEGDDEMNETKYTGPTCNHPHNLPYNNECSVWWLRGTPRWALAHTNPAEHRGTPGSA